MSVRVGRGGWYFPVLLALVGAKTCLSCCYSPTIHQFMGRLVAPPTCSQYASEVPTEKQEARFELWRSR